jgi:GntR family transcriptional regulator
VADVIDFDGPVALYVQLANILRAKIKAGEFQPGRAIPSRKTLMQVYELGHLTVGRALDQLKEEGLIEYAPGRGMFVKQPDPQS